LRRVDVPASQKKILGLVRAIIFFALKEHHWEGINVFSKAGGFKMPFEDNKSERYLTPEEAVALLTELQKASPQLHDMALLSLTTGMRVTEVFGVKANDLDIENNQIWITQKGHRRGCVRVPSAVMKRLVLYGRKGEELLFPSRKGTRLTKVSATFNRIAKRLGLNDDNTSSHKKVIFHTLRHTFASWLAQQDDVSMQDIQQVMRHDSIDMTSRYSHFKPNQGWAKARRVHTILTETQAKTD
jgi:integrase